jgi:hypothetical protein
MSVITDKITAQIEVRIIEFNAIVKVLRSRKFKALLDLHQPSFSLRIEVYEERQVELQSEINRLLEAAGGKAEMWRGLFEK